MCLFIFTWRTNALFTRDQVLPRYVSRRLRNIVTATKSNRLIVICDPHHTYISKCHINARICIFVHCMIMKFNLRPSCMNGMNGRSFRANLCNQLGGPWRVMSIAIANFPLQPLRLHLASDGRISLLTAHNSPRYVYRM